MPLGPVFEVEAKLLARRRHVYVFRFVYGLLLLGFTQLLYDWGLRMARFEFGGENTLKVMATVGASLFLEVITFQQVAAFVITPALVAGAIANDRQRGILINLLASRLSAREIVLGKLGVRTLAVFLSFAVGLPITAIVSMLGGIEPSLLLAAFAATCSLTWFLAGLSIFLSTLAKRPRDAILLVYLFEVAWLSIPALLRPLLTIWWPGLQPWLWLFLRALELSSPFAFGQMLSRPSDEWISIYLLLGIEVLLGAGFAVLSMLLLRRVAAGGGKRSRGRPWRRRWLHSAPSDTNPMLWKETAVGRSSWLVRLGVLAIAIPMTPLLAEQTFELSVKAFREVVQNGYGASPEQVQTARAELTEFLGNLTSFLFTLWVLAVSCTAACSVSSEREENTWDSLLCTSLSTEEILAAKRKGASHRFRWLARLIFVLWGLGVVAGSIHPLCVVLLTFTFLSIRLFCSALGTTSSILCRNTGRSLGLTMGVLLVLNSLNLVLYLAGSGPEALRICFIMPVQEYLLVEGHGFIQYLLGHNVPTDWPRQSGAGKMFWGAVIGAGIYGLVGLLMVSQASALIPGRDEPTTLDPSKPTGTPEVVFLDEPATLPAESPAPVGSVLDAEQAARETRGGQPRSD